MKLNKFVESIYGPKFYFHTVLMFFLAFVTASAQFAVTYYLGMIIDAVSMGYNETMSYFWIIIFSLLFFIVGSAFLLFFSGKMKIRFSYRLQNKIGEKICSARYEDIEQIDDGELLAMTTKDAEGIKNWLSLLMKIGCLPAQIGLVILFVFRMNWKFSLITLCLIPLAAIPEVFISKKLERYHSKEKSLYASVLSFFTATIELIMVIKSFQLEDFFQGKNREKLNAYKKAHMKRRLCEQMIEVYGRCFGHITNPILLLLGAYFILAGEMSIGMLTSIILLAGFVGEGLKVLSEIPVCFQSGRASVAHLGKLFLMKDEQEIEEEQCFVSINKDMPIYEVQNLNFMRGNRQILHNVDFNVLPGDKIAIVGPSGCGKSTLFKLLSGLYIPEKGQIYFRGKDISRISPEYIRRNISVTTQETFLFHATFKDNIKIANQNAGDKAVAAAGKKAQIDTYIESFDQGYDTIVNTTVQSISNGQMQRINLARAFLKNTDIFLFDEPTSALEPETAGLVLDQLFSECADKTIILILHNLQEIYRFNKVLMMDDGRVLGFGSHEELMNGCEGYRKLYTQGTVHGHIGGI